MVQANSMPGEPIHFAWKGASGPVGPGSCAERGATLDAPSAAAAARYEEQDDMIADLNTFDLAPQSLHDA